ncbi:Bifunctional protein Aas [Hydrogenovibrio crunogenus]|uniref:Bifunctional protein Aas n=1 Tax=Hydrogenovibrio crunogenus TaxID=39765 RepID=A0A4P7NWG3_9GAMM|nr:AMP-binding protein [Hydrogenovibrio crunogenus]QBZ82040.1 Bifunctional protein Aas [Hydrogenovibrio crunogenus]
MRWLVKILLKLCYRVEISGLEHYHKLDLSGEPMLIIANHTSLLDGLLIGSFLPGQTAFMIDETHTRKWYEKFLLSFVDHFKVEFHNPYATKRVIQELKKGKHCMIFPEGRITTTGSLMKIYEGTGMVAHKANATLLPIHIQGAHKSKLSYLNGMRMAFLKQQWFPKITLKVLSPRKLEMPGHLTGRQKHTFFKNSIYRIMRDTGFEALNESKSVYKALVDSSKEFNAKDICVEDINETTLSRKKLLLGASILGRKLHHLLQDEHRVGVLLPNVSGLPATFFALQAYGYVPAMINFTAGLGPMRSACETAELKTVITSRKFVEVYQLESVVEALSNNVRFVFLEDVRGEIGLVDKLRALLVTQPKSLPGYDVGDDHEAVVLFTSGSEGAPKGVVLSHKNLNSNVNQISSMLTLLPGEQLFNALPTFHSFGLTAGLLWPILKGAKVFLYPSPLHYGVIPEMIYQLNVKILFGTDTFFSGYAKKADPYDFYSVRYMVAGAEKLRPETRRLYADQFHSTILEGYGVTETSPVLAVNVPLSFKNGTVGQLVPGVTHKLRPIEGINAGGSLMVKGPNIMLGYLMPDQPGILQPPKDGWHDTGDVVEVDSEGFISIKGRAKRFAKIGGEMISLTAVESYINKASPEGHHVVVSVADARKGEQLILVTNDESLSRHTVKEAAKAAQVSEIMVPKTVILVEEIPVLGTGKTNYPEVQKIADGHFET